MLLVENQRGPPGKSLEFKKEYSVINFFKFETLELHKWSHDKEVILGKSVPKPSISTKIHITELDLFLLL